MPFKIASQPRLDGFAIGMSTLCLVHCLGLPILIASLPSLAAVLDLPETLHLAAFLLAVPASTLALLGGYRHHGAWLPALFGGLGMLALGGGALGGQPYWVETGLTVTGSIGLTCAHLLNLRLGRGRKLVPRKRARP